MIEPTSPILLALTILDIAALFLSVILGLDVVWRTKGTLDVFAKILTAVVVVRLVERFIPLIDFSGTVTFVNFWPGLLTDLLLLAGFIEFYRMVRKLDGEV